MCLNTAPLFTGHTTQHTDPLIQAETQSNMSRFMPDSALVAAHPKTSGWICDLKKQHRFVCEMSNVEQMKKNRAESVIWLTQNQNKQCSWQKSFPFPAHCGPFSMSSLQTHKCRHWWASNATQTHLEKCKGKREKVKRSRRKMYSICCFLASYNAELCDSRSERISTGSFLVSC